MWMMGYNEVGGELNMADSCTGRKLRPLMPRPNNTCNGLNSSDFISLNHHLASVTDQNKRDFNTQPAMVVSSRWNPTPEQLRTLEELYRRGTRTPTADQIQQITAQLLRYGKIEGKNVFYWFQNHKARERQKRRRQMESCSDNDQHGRDIDIFERKESEANSTAYEVDQTKIWLPSTNCSVLSEEAGSMQWAQKAAVAAESCRAASDHGWMQFDDGELVLQHHQHRRSFMEKNATWQMMQLSCPPPPTHHHLINTTANNITTTTSSTCTNTTTTASMAATTTPTATILSPSPKLIKSSHDQYFNIFIAPYIENSLISDEDDYESQTLQLFPLGSCEGGDGNNGINEKEINAAMNASFTNPYQFFEFLPMKN